MFVNSIFRFTFLFSLFLFPINCFCSFNFNRFNSVYYPVTMPSIANMFAKIAYICYKSAYNVLAYIYIDTSTDAKNAREYAFSVLFCFRKTLMWATHIKLYAIVWFTFHDHKFSLFVYLFSLRKHIYDDSIFTRRICLTLTHLPFTQTHTNAFIHWQR